MAGSKGGRGGRGGSSSGGGGLSGLLRAMSQQGRQGASPMRGSALQLTSAQKKGDYTDNNNPNLIKWQGQTEDKSASYLAKVDNQVNLSAIQQNTGDSWAFHDLPYQRFVSDVGLNAPPAAVLSKADFDKYVQQTGATVLYRGWSGQSSSDRFKQSPNSHVGNGINGDGYYYATDVTTAKGYGSYGTEAALSPNARVVSITDVRAEIARQNNRFQRALSYAGSRGSRTYGPNLGDAQMALKMGFNVIDAGWAVVALTRDALVVCDKRRF